MSINDDRARRLLESSAAPRLTGPVPSGTGQIRFGMGCSMRVLPFVGVAGPPVGGTLPLIGSELLPDGPGIAGPLPAALGSFRIDYTRWPGCPHCGTRHDNPAFGVTGALWVCPICQSRGLSGFNCLGSRDGSWRCLCGNVATSFFKVEKLEVRGSRSAAAAIPSQRLAAPVTAPWQSGVIAPAPVRIPARVSSLPASPGNGPPPLRIGWKR